MFEQNRNPDDLVMDRLRMAIGEQKKWTDKEELQPKNIQWFRQFEERVNSILKEERVQTTRQIVR
jgi:hypothetical protein